MINDGQFVKGLESPYPVQRKSMGAVVMAGYSFHGMRRFLQLVDSEFLRIFSFKKERG